MEKEMTYHESEGMHTLSAIDCNVCEKKSCSLEALDSDELELLQLQDATIGAELNEVSAEVAATAAATALGGTNAFSATIIDDEKPQKRFKIFGFEFAYLFIAMLIGSFIGFMAENLGRVVTKGIFDCRHQIFPFLFAYGIAVFFMYLTLGTPDKMHIFGKRLFKTDNLKNKIYSNIIYFGVVFFFVFFGEIMVGTIYEKTSGFIMWDYSDIPLSFTKYTSVPTTALYAGGAYLLMKFGFTPLKALMQKKMPYKAATIINWSLGTLIVIDFVLTITLMMVFNAPPNYWSFSF